MSAAATAAGYLYASGRLRARAKEGEEPQKREEHRDAQSAPRRRPLRVAALPAEDYPPDYAPAPAPAAKPRPPVKIQYRTKRWRPNE